MQTLSHARQIAAAVLLAAGFLFQLTAQSNGAGTVNYQHMLINYDARSAGMGGASVGMPSALNGVFSNPAVLAGVQRQQGVIGYQAIFDGIWAAPIGFAYPVANVAVFSVGLQTLNSVIENAIDVGLDGEPVYTGLSASDRYLTPSVSAARTFLGSRLFAAVTIKGLYHRMSGLSEINSSKAIAFDLGAQYRLMGERLIAGAVVRNVGVEFDPFVDGESYPIPTLIEAGISYVPRYLPTFRLAADVSKIRGEYLHFKPGVEIEVYPKVFFFRLGYLFSYADIIEQFDAAGGQQSVTTKNNLNTFSGGIGIQPPIEQLSLQFDFALLFRTSHVPLSPVVSVVVDF
jgi:hypothetical protein